MLNLFYYMIPFLFFFSFSSWMMRISFDNGPKKAVRKVKKQSPALLAPDADRPARYGFIPSAVRNRN